VLAPGQRPTASSRPRARSLRKSDARDVTTNGHSDLARCGRRLAAATHRVRTAPRRSTRVKAACATQARILAEPDVLVALRFAATILDCGPTRSRERATPGVDHAAQRAGLLPAIGQAAATIDSLTAATAILCALRPGRSRHRDAGQGQQGCPQVLEKSTLHHRSPSKNNSSAIPAFTKDRPALILTSRTQSSVDDREKLAWS
jgi:hypothetical protein